MMWMCPTGSVKNKQTIAGRSHGISVVALSIPFRRIFLLKLKRLPTTKKACFLSLAVALVLLVTDQLIKYFILQYLKPVGTIPVLEGFLELSYVENTGVAFGMLSGAIWLVILVTLLACAFVIVLLFRYRNHTFFSYATAALVISGGLGNLVDRMHLGYVVDYFHVLFFDYVFNFADCCITVGAICFIIHILFGGAFQEKSETSAAEQEPDGHDAV